MSYPYMSDEEAKRWRRFYDCAFVESVEAGTPRYRAHKHGEYAANEDLRDCRAAKRNVSTKTKL